MADRLDWNVLVIGGHSTTGKSTVARQLGRRFGVPVNQIDDFRIAMQRAIDAAQLPDLHFFLQPEEQIFAHPHSELVERLVRIGSIMSHALEAVIGHHVVTQTSIILEGDGILPSLVTQKRIDGVEVSGKIKGVYVVEPDRDTFLQMWRTRWPEEERSRHEHGWAQLAWDYGQRIGVEAKRLGICVVEPQPWETLEQRIVAAF